MSVKVLQHFRYSALVLTALLSSCSLANDPAVAVSSTNTKIIIHHEVTKETDFFVSQQTILGSNKQSERTDSNQWHDDNRTLTGYFAKHSIDISSCNYEVTVKNHTFKFTPEQELDSLVAYQYFVTFGDCPQVAELLHKLADSRFPATVDSTHKHPSTLYLLGHQTPLSIVSLYGMPTYYPSNVVESVLEHITRITKP
jgi:hypothetical protein